MAAKTTTRRPVTRRRFSIYVVRLKKAVLTNRKFMRENPEYVRGKPCVYVGMSYLPAADRLEQHKNGVHHAGIVRKHHDGLIHVECRLTKPMTRNHALKRETRRAAELRKRGWAVWSK